MKKFLPFIVFMFSIAAANAQTLTWSTDIAPILYHNCTTCHHDGGLAPFSLMDYTSTYIQRFNTSTDVTNRIMPPWPPDPHYCRFANERILSQADIDKINTWVAIGAPMGDTALAPAKPVYTNTSALGTPDLSLRIPDFTVPANQTTDLYQCFVLHTNLSQTEFITGVEIIPGNPSAVHHVLVYEDTTGQAAILDANTPEPGYTNFGGIGTQGLPILLAGWVPGAQPSFMPPNMGINLYANSDLVLQIHYPAGSQNKLDSTRINLKLSNGSLRTVALAPPLNYVTSSLQNGPLHIPANTIDTFEEYYHVPNIADISVLSVAPHCHLIGKRWLSYAVTPANDTIPLIKINNWDFHWQGFYSFRNLLKIPKDSKLYAFCAYDNTVENPDNPSYPPRDVSAGEATTDEMMLVYFAYTLYEPGDENIVIDSSALVDLTDSSSTVSGINDAPANAIVSTPQLYDPVPNPSNSETQFSYFLPDANNHVVIQIFDLNGRLVDEITAPGSSGFNSARINTSSLADGTYISNLVVNNISRTKNLVVAH